MSGKAQGTLKGSAVVSPLSTETRLRWGRSCISGSWVPPPKMLGPHTEQGPQPTRRPPCSPLPSMPALPACLSGSVWGLGHCPQQASPPWGLQAARSVPGDHLWGPVQARPWDSQPRAVPAPPTAPPALSPPKPCVVPMGLPARDQEDSRVACGVLGWEQARMGGFRNV